MDQRVQARLTRRYFDQLTRLPLGYLLKRHGGELLHSLELAAIGSQLVLSHMANSVLPVLIELMVMTWILTSLGQPMLVIVFAATAATCLAIFTTGGLRMTHPAHEVSTASLNVYARLNEGITHLETLRCFGADEQARRRMHDATAALEARWSTLLRLNLGIAASATATFTVSMALCLAVAADAVARQLLTLGGFVLASVYMLQMVRPLELLGSAARDLSRAIEFVRPLLDILTEPTDAAQQDPPTAVPASEPNARRPPAVTFEDLHFAYDPLRPLINGLTLRCAAGRTTAIVGPSGSGKSSLVRLLMRLYAPSAGHILLDERPIDEIPAAQLRAQIGLVSQETLLLHGSIADNIALGMPDASQSDIERAARGAQLHDVILAMPNGYNTEVGERGMQLSGGERQRVAIARALLRRSAFYVLDEPTSMLDGNTEAGILRTLRDVTAGCTTIVIAHRLSTVMHADEIIVLDGGRVMERGHHTDLLAQRGLYADLWAQQVGKHYAPANESPFG